MKIKISELDYYADDPAEEFADIIYKIQHNISLNPYNKNEMSVEWNAENPDQIEPIVIDNLNCVIDGHHRIAGFIAANLTEIPFIRKTD